MFKNLRNKVAVLALVALGLAFGHAWSSQAEKTNGALIYNAIMKDELPDKDGKWVITHEVAQEENEQKEEQEHEGKEPKDADTSTSNWTIRSNGTSPTETTLQVGLRDKIKTAIERLLKNDDVVKYITIHNIASGHIDAKGEKNFKIAEISSFQFINAVCENAVKLRHSIFFNDASDKDLLTKEVCKAINICTDECGRLNGDFLAGYLFASNIKCSQLKSLKAQDTGTLIHILENDGVELNIKFFDTESFGLTRLIKEIAELDSGANNLATAVNEDISLQNIDEKLGNFTLSEKLHNCLLEYEKRQKGAVTEMVDDKKKELLERIEEEQKSQRTQCMNKFIYVASHYYGLKMYEQHKDKLKAAIDNTTVEFFEGDFQLNAGDRGDLTLSRKFGRQTWKIVLSIRVGEVYIKHYGPTTTRE